MIHQTLARFVDVGGARYLQCTLPGGVADPPIPIRVTLPEPGVVTLVLEDHAGLHVRNLVSERPLPAGENVVGWDALDDLRRNRRCSRKQPSW